MACVLCGDETDTDERTGCGGNDQVPALAILRAEVAFGVDLEHVGMLRSVSCGASHGDDVDASFFAGGEIAGQHLYGYTAVLTVFTAPEAPDIRDKASTKKRHHKGALAIA